MKHDALIPCGWCRGVAINYREPPAMVGLYALTTDGTEFEALDRICGSCYAALVEVRSMRSKLRRLSHHLSAELDKP